ncbi:MAG: flagellar motor switch protein FliM [Firmicutes bacterium]|nr:flagellar motor switch protein FliM [Bacillota bacterium]
MSQLEIDSLINSLLKEESPSRESTTRDNRARVRVYDFRRPDKFSKDQMRTLQMVHDNYARLITTFFSANFRTMVQIAVSSVDQLTYEQYLKGVASPAVLGITSLEPLPGNAILELTSSIAFPIIDRLFGGPGMSMPAVRPLTEIEQMAMERVYSGLLSNLEEAWKGISEFSPRLEMIEVNPLFAQIVPPTEIVVIISMDVRLGEHRGGLNLCLPYLLLEPVIPKLTAHQWFAGNRSQQTPERSQLEQGLLETEVEVVVQLGGASITVRDFLGLEVGDVMELDTSITSPVGLLVGGKIKFLGKVGRAGRRLAFRTESVCSGREDD